MEEVRIEKNFKAWVGFGYVGRALNMFSKPGGFESEMSMIQNCEETNKSGTLVAFHLFNKYLVNNYYVSSSILDKKQIIHNFVLKSFIVQLEKLYW